jgi:hypothetical protein
MNTYLTETLLFFSIFFIIFDQIPQVLRLNFLSGGFASRLSFYPLFILGLYLLYVHHKEKITLINSKYFFKYISVYFSIILFSTILGLINYPYFNIIFNGPVDQIEKLPAVSAFLTNHGFNIEDKLLLSVWMVVRILKSCLIKILYTFGFAYTVYYFTCNNWNESFCLYKKAIYFSLGFMFIYSFFELLYLSGAGIEYNYVRKS